MKLLLRIHIVVSLWLSSVSGEWRIGQSVQTTSGIVHGQGAGLKGNEEVSEYLGIPFAAPPVGHLRWKPPQRFTKSDSPIIASSWGPSCPSSQTSGSHMDESCLTINVWTKPQNGSTKKAVLFSIYGGGFNTGSSNTPYLNGAPLANRQDVVVVSLNYRLNIFGFPGIPGIEDNNLGMMDIRAGVEWVRDNIAVFGGDPKRITMFGESAGGGACDYYAFAWRDDPIVNGFIIQSGSVHTRGIAADNNRKPWHVVSSALGCAGEEINVNTLDCMRGKDWKSIMSHVDTGPRNPGKTFGPTFDEKVIFKDYEARGKKGLFAQVPILIGSNENEAGFFNLLKPLTNDKIHRLNLCFTCVARYSAASRAAFNVPVWRYLYFGDWANVRRAPGIGAFHGSELSLVYGTPKFQESTIQSSSAENEVEELLMSSWAGFARDPYNYLSTIGWPKYVSDKSTLIRIAYNNSQVISLTVPDQYDIECKPVYEPSIDSIDSIMYGSGG